MTRAKSVPLGPLSNRSRANGHFVTPPQNFPAPIRLCNASSRSQLVLGSAWSEAARAGSMAAFSLPSKGGGC